MQGLHEFDVPSINGALAGAGVHATAAYDTGGSPTATREFGAVFSSDVASAADGAVIQASPDNVTWKTVAVATLAAGVPQTVSAPVVGRYMRAQLTNAAGAAAAAYVQVFRRRN